MRDIFWSQFWAPAFIIFSNNFHLKLTFWEIYISSIFKWYLSNFLLIFQNNFQVQDCENWFFSLALWFKTIWCVLSSSLFLKHLDHWAVGGIHLYKLQAARNPRCVNASVFSARGTSSTLLNSSGTASNYCTVDLHKNNKTKPLYFQHISRPLSAQMDMDFVSGTHSMWHKNSTGFVVHCTLTFGQFAKLFLWRQGWWLLMSKLFLAVRVFLFFCQPMPVKCLWLLHVDIYASNADWEHLLHWTNTIMCSATANYHQIWIYESGKNW